MCRLGRRQSSIHKTTAGLARIEVCKPGNGNKLQTGRNYHAQPDLEFQRADAGPYSDDTKCPKRRPTKNCAGWFPGSASAASACGVRNNAVTIRRATFQNVARAKGRG